MLLFSYEPTLLGFLRGFLLGGRGQVEGIPMSKMLTVRGVKTEQPKK